MFLNRILSVFFTNLTCFLHGKKRQNLATYTIGYVFVQLSAKRETSGEKSRQLRDAQQDARDKMEVSQDSLIG